MSLAACSSNERSAKERRKKVVRPASSRRTLVGASRDPRVGGHNYGFTLVFGEASEPIHVLCFLGHATISKVFYGFTVIAFEGG